MPRRPREVKWSAQSWPCPWWSMPVQTLCSSQYTMLCLAVVVNSVSTWLGQEMPRYLFKHYLDACVRVSLEETNIWIGGLSKADGSSQYWHASSSQLRVWIEQKHRGRLKSLCVTDRAETLIFSCPQHSWISGLQTQTCVYNIDFPDSLACRQQQLMGLLSLCIHVCQHFIINIFLDIHVLFCFSRELWLIH